MRARFSSGLLLLFLATITVSAQEWTQWRGPTRDGSVSAKNAPAWAMPVLLGSNILVRDATGLMLLTAGK